ncbi:MFS transporter, partial [Desulfofundulus sp.]|uniref:MFS transporter n=1 Tax=Desulfofundulus sp. TaxID=2282750 RepID=UPI003C74CF27
MKTGQSGLKKSGCFSTFRALQYRNFRLLWISLLISNAGTWMQMVAQGWLIYELTRSAFYLGLVGLMQAVPRFTFSLFGGAVADRLDRKRLLCFTQAAAMSLALILAVLAYTRLIRVWHILVVSFLNSLVMTFDQPARQALVSDLVDREDLVNAIALNSMAFNGAAVLGPSLGGFLLSAMGAPGCFFLNGVSFLAVIAALYRMNVPVASEREFQGH